MSQYFRGSSGFEVQFDACVEIFYRIERVFQDSVVSLFDVMNWFQFMVFNFQWRMCLARIGGGSGQFFRRSFFLFSKQVGVGFFRLLGRFGFGILGLGSYCCYCLLRIQLLCDGLFFLFQLDGIVGGLFFFWSQNYLLSDFCRSWRIVGFFLVVSFVVVLSYGFRKFV